MSENTWNEYFERTKNAKPRPLLIKALEYVNNKDNALDLGSGALNDVRYLVLAGFKHITAVDHEPLAKDIIQHFPVEVVDYVISTFENFSFIENTYDLINAQYALPFSSKKTFPAVFSKIKNSLKSGGILTGQFFGERDEWNKEDNSMNFHTEKQTKELLNGLEILEFKEEEADKPTAAGNIKHWHVFHFIARK